MQEIEALLLESFGNFFFKNIFPWTSVVAQLVVFQNKYQNHIFLCVFCHSDLLHFFFLQHCMFLSFYWKHQFRPWQFPVYHWTLSFPGSQAESHWSGQTEVHRMKGQKLRLSQGSLVWHTHEAAALSRRRISPRPSRTNICWWDSVWGNVQADPVTWNVWPLPVMVLLAPPGAEKRSW